MCNSIYYVLIYDINHVISLRGILLATSPHDGELHG